MTGAPAVSNSPVRQRRWPYMLVRVLVALALFAEAALKTHQLSTEPVAKYEFFGRSWLIFFAEFKILFGLWLIFGLHKRLAWLVATILLAIGTCVTLYQGLQGHASCGCLGRVQLSPWYAMTVYAAGLAALLACRPKVKAASPDPRYKIKLAAVLTLTLAAGIPAAASMAAYTPSALSETGEIIGSDPFVVLDVEGWVNKKFPLARHIDIGERLMQGRWTVMLFHWDCPYCREAIAKYEQEARKLAKDSAALRIALVAVPPYAPDGQGPVAKDTACLTGRLMGSRDWFVATPAVLELVEGQVASAKEAQMDFKSPAYDLRLAGTVTPAAVIRVPADTAQFDFGLVDPNSLQAVVFSIENSSGQPLVIARAQSECQCMMAPNPPKLVPAGASADLRLNFLAPKDKIKYSKRMLVMTGDPKRPKIVIQINAAVGMPMRVEPQPLDAGTLIHGEHKRATAEFWNDGKVPLRLLYSTSSNTGAVALIPRTPVPAGGKLSVPVEIRTEQLPANSTGALVCAHTEHGSQTQLDFAVKYQISKAYRLSSGVLEMGYAQPGKAMTAAIQVEANSPQPGKFITDCQLKDLRNASGAADVSYDGTKATIRCSLTAGKDKGPIDGVLILRLAGHPQPVELPLAGKVEE